MHVTSNTAFRNPFASSRLTVLMCLVHEAVPQPPKRLQLRPVTMFVAAVDLNAHQRFHENTHPVVTEVKSLGSRVIAASINRGAHHTPWHMCTGHLPADPRAASGKDDCQFVVPGSDQIFDLSLQP